MCANNVYYLDFCVQIFSATARSLEISDYYDDDPYLGLEKYEKLLRLNSLWPCQIAIPVSYCKSEVIETVFAHTLLHLHKSCPES